MRISVVIATFNRAALLEETLAELRRQPFQPGDEVIVVDNASTDDTPGVIARAARDFPVPLRALRETISGKSPALNAGIAAASGDVLALTDDDVLVAPDWVAAVRQVFEDSTIALAGGRVEPRWERPAPSWLVLERDGRYSGMASPLALLHYGEAQELGPRTAVGANLAVRREVLETVGAFAPHLGRRSGTLLCGEDHEFCQRASAAGFRCEYRPEMRVRHWVPAERARLTYYLRWFFWSGVTHAVLERDEQGAGPMIRPYLVRRLMTAPAVALGRMLTGRPADAAASVMDVAFVVGNISQRLRYAGTLRRHEVATPHAAMPGRPQAPPPA